MRYKPKSIAALQVALGGLPDRMRVEVDSDISVSAKTVGALRKVTAWPDNLAILTPQEHYPESAVKVSKALRRARPQNGEAGCLIDVGHWLFDNVQ
jgi:hypothetical protein